MSCLLPKNSESLDRVISYIDTQFENPVDGSFQVDENIAKIAQQIFRVNFRKNLFISWTATVFGVVGAVGIISSAAVVFGAPFAIFAAAAGFGSTAAIANVFYYAVCAALVNAVFIMLFVSLRNREGYLLQDALRAEQESDKIRLLSLGANVYQTVWDNADAAPEIITLYKSGPTTLAGLLARKGHIKTLAYVLMLEKDKDKRAKLATEAISESKDIKTAQILLNFGAKPEDCDISFCCEQNNLEVTKFLVTRGAPINAGIENYKQWQADIPQTPLEKLTIPDKDPLGRPIQTPSTKNPRLAFKALRIDRSAYTGKKNCRRIIPFIKAMRSKNPLTIRKQNL